MLGRKELFKNTLRKAAHAWRKIIELRLNGEVVDHFLSFAFGFQFFFLTRSQFVSRCIFYLSCFYNHVCCILAEEEAYILRFYVDEPAFIDLHWV